MSFDGAADKAPSEELQRKMVRALEERLREPPALARVLLLRYPMNPAALGPLLWHQLARWHGVLA